MASERVPEIDLLRFAAAAALVGYHNTYRIPVNGIPSDEAFPLVQAVTKFGYLGVELFFLISGFVILWSASGKTVRQFAMSRALRLYPSFWVSIALTLCALAVEILLWAWLAGLALCQLHVPIPGLVSVTMFPYGQLFAGGCWAYLIRSRGGSPARLVGFGVALLLGVASSGVESKNFLHEPSATDILIVQSLIGLFFGAILSVALRWWTLKRAHLAVTLGALTYPLYLLHNKIGKLLYAATDSLLPTVVGILLFTGVGIGLAAVVTALVERKLIQYLGRTKAYRWLAGSSGH